MPASRRSSRRRPSIKCRLKTKVVPHGGPARGPEYELHALFRQKQALRQISQTSNVMEQDKLKSGTNKRDCSSSKADSKDIVETQMNIFERWKLKEEKENNSIPVKSNMKNTPEKKQLPAKAGKPIVSQNIREIQEQMSRTVKFETRAVSGSNLSPGSQQSPRNSPAVPPAPQSGTSPSRATHQGNPQVKKSSSPIGDDHATTKNKTSRLAALFESNIAQGGPSRNVSTGKFTEQNNTMRDGTSTTPSVNKPMLPLKPASALPEKPNNKPTVPKKSIDSAKLLDFKKKQLEMPLGDNTMLEKPCVPNKPLGIKDLHVTNKDFKATGEKVKVPPKPIRAKPNVVQQPAPNCGNGTVLTSNGAALISGAENRKCKLFNTKSNEYEFVGFPPVSNVVPQTCDEVPQINGGSRSSSETSQFSDGQTSPSHRNNSSNENVCEDGWRDCETTARDTRVVVPKWTKRTKSRRQRGHNSGKDQRTQDKARVRPNSEEFYQDIVLPGEISDSDSWQTEDEWEEEDFDDDDVYDDVDIDSQGTASPTLPHVESTPSLTATTQTPPRRNLPARDRLVDSVFAKSDDLSSRSHESPRSRLSWADIKSKLPDSPKLTPKAKPQTSGFKSYISEFCTELSPPGKGLSSSPSSVSSSSTASSSSCSSMSSGVTMSERSRQCSDNDSVSSDKPPPLPPGRHRRSHDQLPPASDPPPRPPKTINREFKSRDVPSSDEPPALPPPRVKLTLPNSQSVSRRGHYEGMVFRDSSSRRDSWRSSYGSSTDSTARPYLQLLDDDLLGETDVDGQESAFINEPLYQIYHSGVVAREVWENNNDILYSDDEENPECFPQSTMLREDDIHNIQGTLERMAKHNATSSEVQSTLQTLARSSQNCRTLWCETPEVKQSGLLATMSAKDKKFQESLFEIITSEASYLKSLSIFLATFHDNPGISGREAVISDSDRKQLFSNITLIRDISERFMKELEGYWKENVLMTTQLCEIITTYASGDFSAYVKYCGNLDYQERKLSTLRKSNERFQQLVLEFERKPECNSLPIQTFLTLPMQRITRLPLLVDAVCQRTDPHTPYCHQAQTTLISLQKLVKSCNERARQMADIEQNTEIDRSLNFMKIKKIAIVSQSRHLVKKGKLTRIFKEQKRFLGNKKKDSLYLFLFSDLLIVTKKKTSVSSTEPASYQVIDYADRNAIMATEIDGTNFTQWLPNGAPSGCHNLFVLAMLENHEHKHAEFLFACEQLSERTRWVDAVTSVNLSEDGKIYEPWDCPQVQVIHRYVASQPDELSLEESDVINVFRKLDDDGWYEGERIRDGEKGWFPANHTVEIHSAHVRARNLRLRYRLLTLPPSAMLETAS